jgi:hypothetical protein
MASLKPFDPWSVIVIALTGVLFAAASFVKCFTHDLFIEAGVLLVSIKLILWSKGMREARKIWNGIFYGSRSCW